MRTRSAANRPRSSGSAAGRARCSASSTACTASPVADGLILGEAYGGRILHFDPSTRKVTVLARGLKNPGFALPAASGGYFVSEFFGARISHVWPDGHVTTVAHVVKPGPIEFDSHRRIVGVTLNGKATLFRIERGRARTIYP